MMAEINLPWLTVEHLLDLKKTSEDHPDRILYVNNAARFWRHFRSSNEWWVPMDEVDDMNLNERGALSRNNIINRSAKELNSLILKNDPVVILHPRNPSDSDLSDTMDDILMAAWRNSGAKKVLRSTELEAQVTGMGVMKIGWNPGNLKLGAEGDVILTKREYGNIWFDPFATNEKNGDDCAFIIDRTYQTPEAILAMYGEKGAKALGVKLTTVGRPRKTLLGYLETFKEKFTNAIRGYDNDQNAVDRRIPVYEFWLFTADIMYQLSTGLSEKKEKLYPYGVVATLIDDEIVRTIENPFAGKRRVKFTQEYGEETSNSVDVGHRKHPFVIDYWWRTANAEGRNGIYCCEGSVVQQVPLQYAYNKLRRNTEINAETIANPNFFYLADAIEMEETNITLGPAEGIPINPKYAGGGINNAIQFNNGKEIPMGVFNMLIDTKNDIEAAAGLKPGMVGNQPLGTSHTSGDAIGMMQESAYSSMWAPTDELNECLYELAFRYLGLIQQFYRQGRFIDVSDPVVGQERFVEFNQRLIAAAFSLQVVSGTTTPMYDVGRVQWQKEIKAEVDMALDTGSIDRMKSCLVYLANLRLPYVANWMQLLKQKIEEQTAIQEQMQMLGAAGLQSGAFQMGSAPPAGTANASGQPGEAPAFSEGEGENAGIEEYASELGLTREQLEQALQNIQ